jgi:hypothetical protein
MLRAMPIPRHLVVLALALACSGLGCDKLKAMSGKGDADGGAASSSGGSGGGLLSLFGSDFEGEITMAMTTKASQPPVEMVFGIKKPKLRIDAQKGIPGAAGGGGIGVGAGKGAVLLVDPSQKKGWALAPAEKKAVLFDFEKMKTMGPVPGMPGAFGAKPPSAPPKFEKGGKDKVAGYACDVFKVTHDNGKRSELCLADGIAWIDLSDVGFQSPEIAAAAAVAGVNHFPLRVVVTDASGAVESRMEATKVEKKKLDEASFSVPPDYQVTDLAAMMGMMRGAGGGLPPGAMPPGAMPPGARPKGR